MLFNSVEFAIFLPIVFTIYWLLRKYYRVQNFVLLVSSYFFYGWWDYRFLALIVLSSFIDYFIGIYLQRMEKDIHRKLLLSISLLVNLGLLGFFKYYNFFLDNFVTAYSFFGQTLKTERLNIILPVGISFYTFQTLSYSIDVYRRKIEATKDILAFFSFVSFFPQLVAGPIERASNLLPQFEIKRSFDYQLAVDGLRQILWGFFKKVVIADNCAVIVNEVFANHSDYGGSTLILGAVFFAFQIYGDFSGYSDIAIGLSRLFGFNLKRNFAYPYFSRSIGEFWRRWHISLSFWFRDYVYIPLGGSRVSKLLMIRNTFIIFLVSGFWHGANWTFVVWGLFNALLFLPSYFRKGNKEMDLISNTRLLPSVNEAISIVTTFFLITIGWVFFRSENIGHSFSYLSGIFSVSLFQVPQYLTERVVLWIVLMLTIEWLQRDKEHALQFGTLLPRRYMRWSLYYIILFLLLIEQGTQQGFIYFQF